MNLPRYFIVGLRAVKFVKTGDDEHVDILVFDRKENNFVENIDYLERVYTSDESEEVTEQEFNAYVNRLKTGDIYII